MLLVGQERNSCRFCAESRRRGVGNLKGRKAVTVVVEPHPHCLAELANFPLIVLKSEQIGTLSPQGTSRLLI